MTVVDDSTALNGSAIDVAARIAWTMRMARLTAGVDDTRMKAVAATIGTSPARLSRAETGLLRDGSLVDSYERALVLPEGSLRAPVDVTARTFPHSSPPDSRPGVPISSVRELSDLTERLDAGDDVTGGEWLRWSRAISAPGNIGLPVPLAQRVVGRLVVELSRSCGHGYPSRYEALAKIRCSHYGFLVLRAARHEVAHPHAQRLADLLSAVGEAVTPDAVEWCLGLLRADRPSVAVCGALALENMGEISPTGAFWPGVVPSLVEAFDDSAPGSVQEGWIAHLIRLVPATTWPGVQATPGRPLPPAPEVEGFDRAEANRQWRLCTRVAGDVGREAGVGEQPMLARLLFDIGFGHWETRAVTAYFLLGALPAIAQPLWNRFATMVADEPDQRIRHRMARRLQGALAGRLAGPTTDWLDSSDPVLRSAALQIVGSAGSPLVLDDVRRALADPDTALAATYALGMSGHPGLPEVANDSTFDDDVRGSAAWWLERGSRLAV
jgi:hypothetical protein